MSEDRPYLNFDSPDVQVVSMKKAGLFNREWEVRWKKRGESTTHILRINRHTVGGTDGGGFKVTWGD